MTQQLFIDIETYSSVDLPKYGVYAYAESPDFCILMATYALDDDPVQVAFGDDILNIPELWDPNVEKVAHNAQFERVCFSVVNPSFGGNGRYLPPEHWFDTMALAAEHGFPQKLETLARWLGGEQKDSAGTALIRWFCVPDTKGRRRLPEEHPEKWAAFVSYGLQDTETHRDVCRRLPPWPPAEREVWNVDQRINDRGVVVDLPLARAAVDAAEMNRMEQELRVSSLTGVVNPSSGDQMLGWLRTQGHTPTNMQAATVTELLARDDLSDVVQEVLEVRQELALVASSKYSAILGGVSADGRLRGQFRFFGAHTGRWSGRGVQLHNLPRLGFKTDSEVELAIVDLLLGYPTSSDVLKRLVRPTILLNGTVVDYSAIEARVLPWMAGEEWALQAFRDGRDIYVETAERMSTTTSKLTRFQGKVAVLALGYNGAVNSLRAMGADGTDDELMLLVRQWRRTNPAIVSMWREMGQAFQHGGPVGVGLVTVEVDGRDRMIRLPSGRAITYHFTKWEWEPSRYDKDKKDLVCSFRDPSKGFSTRTYGGRLVENVTQAVARDLLAVSLVTLERQGYQPVGHVHDEALVERGSIEEVKRVMTTAPSWAAGLPLDGAGYSTVRYRKD
jgi:DNA polymerase